MIGVCLTYAHNAARENEWNYVLSHFAAERLWVIGGAYDTSLLRQAVQIDSASDLPIDLPLVVLSPRSARFVPGTESLVDFQHPDDCIYLFGPDNLHLSDEELGGRSPDHVVYIPVDSKDEMFSYVAAAVTLYDRRVKRG